MGEQPMFYLGLQKYNVTINVSENQEMVLNKIANANQFQPNQMGVPGQGGFFMQFLNQGLNNIMNMGG